MQPDELKTIVEEAVRAGTAYPWWALVLGAAGAGIGTYIASYLGKKGEYKATREDFESIRQQLKTTTDTEEIKDMLTGKAWRSQQQWSAREQYYSDLLTHLHTFKLALTGLSDYYMEPGSEHAPDSQQGEHFQSLLKSSHESYKALRKQIGPAALFLSAGALKALDEMASKHWELANFSVCTADYVSAALRLSETAYSKVLTEAKDQLMLTQN